MKNLKKVIALVLCLTTIFSVMSISVSAANYTNNYKSYSQPSTKNDYAYYNVSSKKVVRASCTTVSEVKWMQSAINFCITSRGLSGVSKLDVDGSFGKLSRAATLKFQEAVNNAIANKKLSISKLTVDGKFGPATISAMIKVINSNNSSILKSTSSNNSSASSTATNNEGNWMWPTSYRRISCGFADNIYHTSHWHRGIDIPVSSGTDVYASKSGTIALVVNDKITEKPSRGTYIVIDHGDGYYSEYQHLKSVSVKQGDTVKQGDVIAKSGKTDNTSDGGSEHLHFEIMYLGKSGLGASYTNYWNSYSKYVNTNPKNTDKVFCTKGNSYKEFKIGQKQNDGVPTANLVKTSNKASYGVYCYDTNGIYYVFK